MTTFRLPVLRATDPTAAAREAVPMMERVTQALGRTRWHLRFEPALEAHYEASTAGARSREMVVAALVALAVYDLFLVKDWIARPQVFGLALAWRIGFETTCTLVVIALIRRGVAARWHETMLASALVCGMFASTRIFLADHGPSATFDPFGTALFFMAGNIALGLRFVPALASSAVNLAIACPAVVTHPQMPAIGKPTALMVLIGTAVLTLVGCYRIDRSARRLFLLWAKEELQSEQAHRSAREFAQLSETDALTGLPNRRAFDSRFAQRWLEAAQQRQPLTLLLVDIDEFKRFNDTYGHPAGDDCLRRVAGAMQGRLRDGDFVARLGGEEFGVLLQPGATPSAELLAERLREAVQALGIVHAGSTGARQVTISIGMATHDPSGGGGAHALMAAADHALYEAKRNGRNRCVFLAA